MTSRNIHETFTKHSRKNHKRIIRDSSEYLQEILNTDYQPLTEISYFYDFPISSEYFFSRLSIYLSSTHFSFLISHYTVFLIIYILRVVGIK